jgi:hypothetical protein
MGIAVEGKISLPDCSAFKLIVQSMFLLSNPALIFLFRL